LELIFSSCIVTRDDHMIVIALFDGDPATSVGLLRGSEQAATALLEALAEVLGSPPNSVSE